MFRYALLFALSTVLPIACVAQTHGDNPSEPALNSASQHQPNDASSQSQIAQEARISITRLKEPRKARKLYREAMKVWQKHKPADAQRKLDQALKVYPTFPEALTFYGGIYATLQQWGPAEQKLLSAVESDPSYSAAYVVLAGVYNAEKRFDEASVATQKAISSGANTWDVQYEISCALIGKREYETALVTTENALRKEQHGSLLYLAKAHALLGLRRYGQAAAELRNYLRYEPSGDGSTEARALLQRIGALR